MKRIIFQVGKKENPPKARRIRRILKKLVPIAIIIGILSAFAIFLATLSGSESIIKLGFLGNPFKSSDGKVNILFLGIPGGTHAGSNLTDTIMVASYNLKTNHVFLISIPRDLWFPALRSKANAVYQIGLSEKDGLDLTKTVMGNVLGIPIHYALRIDFRGFIQAIDALGGIDVVVDKSFDDFNYPISGKEDDLCGFEEKEMDFSEEDAKKLNIEAGKRKVFISPDGKIATDSAEEDKGIMYFSCRYEHISFKEGLTHMDGDTALKFVRSRHGTNGQGSDFARSERAEKTLQAVRSKVLSLETLSNPAKIAELIKTLGKSVDTDVSAKDAFEFYKLSKKLDQTHKMILDDSKRNGLEEGRASLLYHPSPEDYGGAYVLVSQDDDFSVIHNYVRKVLEGEITEYEATASSRAR